jgi:hypothetical protein
MHIPWRWRAGRRRRRAGRRRRRTGWIRIKQIAVRDAHTLAEAGWEEADWVDSHQTNRGTGCTYLGGGGLGGGGLDGSGGGMPPNAPLVSLLSTRQSLVSRAAHINTKGDCSLLNTHALTIRHHTMTEPTLGARRFRQGFDRCRRAQGGAVCGVQQLNLRGERPAHEPVVVQPPAAPAHAPT